MSTEASVEKELSIKLIILKIGELYRFVLANFVFVLVFGIIGVLCGIAYAWVKPPVYQATLTFTTQDDKNATSNLQGLAAQFGFNLGGTSTIFSGDNLSALIQSKKIMTNALLQPIVINNVKTNLLNRYLDFKKKNNDLEDTVFKKVTFPLDQDPSTYSRNQDSVLSAICDGLLKKNVSASRPDKKLDLFAIICSSEDETFSIYLVKQLINVTSAFYIETKTKRSSQTVSILQRKADSIKAEYNLALAGRADISDANLNPAFQVPQVAIQKRQTDITVLSTAYTEIVKNLEVAKFNLLQSTPLIQVIDEPVAPVKKTKPGRLSTGIIWGFLFSILGILCASMIKEIKRTKTEKLNQPSN